MRSMRIRRKKRMAEYISKQAAVDAGYLSDWYISSVGDEPPAWTDAHIDELLNDFIVIPKDTPSADVQPVKRGRWLEHHAIWIDQPEIEGWFVQAKCSECEKWAHVMNPYTKSVDYECCPHCGARMDGDTE